MVAPNDSQVEPRHILKDFEGGTSIALIVMFAVSTTAQLYSRHAVGRLFFGCFLVGGLFLQSIFYIYKSGFFYADAVALSTMVAIAHAAWSLHIVERAWNKTRGVHLYSYAPGYGWLNYLYPTLPPWANNLLSDVVAASTLAFVLHVADSPVQRDWFLWAVLPSLGISQTWVQCRDAHLKQQHVDATAQAAHYSSTIQKR